MKLYSLLFHLIFINIPGGKSQILIKNMRENGVTTAGSDPDQDAEIWNIDVFSELAPYFLLSVQNLYRIKHEVPILVLDPEISAYSQEWASQLAKDRRVYSSPNREYGENMYFENFAFNINSPASIVHHWYKEVRNYHKSMAFKDLNLISNFTQMIWKSSESLGVGVAYNNFNELYVVCNYEPPGNIVQDFKDNIIEPVIDYSYPDAKLFLEEDLASSFKHLAWIRFVLINSLFFTIIMCQTIVRTLLLELGAFEY